MSSPFGQWRAAQRDELPPSHELDVDGQVRAGAFVKAALRSTVAGARQIIMAPDETGNTTLTFLTEPTGSD